MEIKPCTICQYRQPTGQESNLGSPAYETLNWYVLLNTVADEHNY